jgi:hypothetical protein
MQFNIGRGKKILKEKLGSLYERAEIIFNNYGEKLSFDVANVLMHAADQGEEAIKEVLDLLENHFNKNLAYQHPDVRGMIYNSVGINETQTMFLDICEKTLGLEPMEKQEIPDGPFIVKTRNSIYRFSKDEGGKRNVSRDKKPLDFSRCKITKLIIGDEMVLERLDDSGFELATTTVLSIETP